MQNNKPAFATGYGQSDTHAKTLSDGRSNPSESAGKPYATVTGADIAAMVKDPPSVPKERGQWFIPSAYTAADARCHDAQRAQGAFLWLTLDVDENNLDLTEIDAALSEVIGDASRLIYSSRGASEDCRKWRALVPIKGDLAGAEFSDVQNAFFDLLEHASGGVLIPDRALSRPAQLVYLPNKGAFYQHAIHKGAGRLELTPDHPIIAHRDRIAAERAKAAREAQEARERRAAQRAARAQSDDVSPVDHFNAAHAVADLLARYGYTQAGSSPNWKSPFQSSGSYATQDRGEFWISLSGNDDAQEIGAATQNGHRHGDAFDLYCHFEHGGDFNAAVRAYALEAGLNRPKRETPATGQHSAAQRQETQEPAPAGDPVDLWGSFDPPELPQGLLPPIIEDFARANAAQMGADPAGLAMAALVTCAAAIPDAVQIKVKRHDDWTESARLWAALMGPPSAKKSPIISAATGPLCRLDVEMMRAWQKRVSEYWALDKAERTGPPPPQTRLRIEDATMEGAQQVLEGSPWGVLMLQDELSGFFGAMDKYNGGKGAQADRAFWLRSFNGGQFALNRVGRGAAIIENLSVSMLGGIQPEPLRKVAGDSVDDGLLQRLFPIMLRTATMGRDEPMPPVNSQYRSLIERLRKLTPPGFGGQGVLEFDTGAQIIRRDLEARHLELQSLETINRKLASHIGKYDGMFARLCVVWHCIENTGQDMPATVTEATAQRVAYFLHRFLLAHAISFYSGVLGLSDDHDRLTAIAGYILTHKLERITNRDVQRGDRTMRGLKDHEIRPLLEQLAALGWLDRIDPPRPSSPPHWQVNPAVHAKFADRAERETERRSKARETIRDLVKGEA